MSSPAVGDEEETQRDLAAYGRLVELWAQENPIKTNKLQVLLAVNGLLLTGIQLTGGFVRSNWPLCAAGALFSMIWTFSIGRTVLFQKTWQLKAEEISRRHTADIRFQVLQTDEYEKRIKGAARVFGVVSSKYYLLVSPAVFTAVWLAVLVRVLLRD
jgi:hypothetical protein